MNKYKLMASWALILVAGLLIRKSFGWHDANMDLLIAAPLLIISGWISCEGANEPAAQKKETTTRKVKG